MQHRHLLPNEIDLLLDSEVGFGLAPLRAHVDTCSECRRHLDDARVVVDALDALPRFAPAPSFAPRIMAGVQVVEPWHVALVATAKRLAPRSAPMRAVMAVSAGVLALGISSAAVWLSFRTDVAVYLGGLVNERLRAVLVTGLTDAVRGLFGDGALAAFSSQGSNALLLGAVVLVAAGASAAFGLRALATASRRARE